MREREKPQSSSKTSNVVKALRKLKGNLSKHKDEEVDESTESLVNLTKQLSITPEKKKLPPFETGLNNENATKDLNARTTVEKSEITEDMTIEENEPPPCETASNIENVTKNLNAATTDEISDIAKDLTIEDHNSTAAEKEDSNSFQPSVVSKISDLIVSDEDFSVSFEPQLKSMTKAEILQLCEILSLPMDGQKEKSLESLGNDLKNLHVASRTIEEMSHLELIHCAVNMRTIVFSKTDRELRNDVKEKIFRECPERPFEYLKEFTADPPFRGIRLMNCGATCYANAGANAALSIKCLRRNLNPETIIQRALNDLLQKDSTRAINTSKILLYDINDARSEVRYQTGVQDSAQDFLADIFENTLDASQLYTEFNVTTICLYCNHLSIQTESPEGTIPFLDVKETTTEMLTETALLQKKCDNCQNDAVSNHQRIKKLDIRDTTEVVMFSARRFYEPAKSCKIVPDTEIKINGSYFKVRSVICYKSNSQNFLSGHWWMHTYSDRHTWLKVDDSKEITKSDDSLLLGHTFIYEKIPALNELPKHLSLTKKDSELTGSMRNLPEPDPIIDENIQEKEHFKPPEKTTEGKSGDAKTNNPEKPKVYKGAKNQVPRNPVEQTKGSDFDFTEDYTIILQTDQVTEEYVKKTLAAMGIEFSGSRRLPSLLESLHKNMVKKHPLQKEIAKVSLPDLVAFAAKEDLSFEPREKETLHQSQQRFAKAFAMKHPEKPKENFEFKLRALEKQSESSLLINDVLSNKDFSIDFQRRLTSMSQNDLMRVFSSLEIKLPIKQQPGNLSKVLGKELLERHIASKTINDMNLDQLVFCAKQLNLTTTEKTSVNLRKDLKEQIFRTCPERPLQYMKNQTTTAPFVGVRLRNTLNASYVDAACNAALSLNILKSPKNPSEIQKTLQEIRKAAHLNSQSIVSSDKLLAIFQSLWENRYDKVKDTEAACRALRDILNTLPEDCAKLGTYKATFCKDCRVFTSNVTSHEQTIPLLKVREDTLKMLSDDYDIHQICPKCESDAENNHVFREKIHIPKTTQVLAFASNRKSCQDMDTSVVTEVSDRNDGVIFKIKSVICHQDDGTREGHFWTCTFNEESGWHKMDGWKPITKCNAPTNGLVFLYEKTKDSLVQEEGISKKETLMDNDEAMDYSVNGTSSNTGKSSDEKEQPKVTPYEKLKMNQRDLRDMSAANSRYNVEKMREIHAFGLEKMRENKSTSAELIGNPVLEACQEATQKVHDNLKKPEERCDVCHEGTYGQIIEISYSRTYEKKIPMCGRCKIETNGKNFKEIPIFSILNNMVPGDQPEIFKMLTRVEQNLIRMIVPLCQVWVRQGGSRGLRGNVVSFYQDLERFVLRLPRSPEEMACIVARTETQKQMTFTMRPGLIRECLIYLKANNPCYANIIIDDEKMKFYEDNNGTFQVPEMYQNWDAATHKEIQIDNEVIHEKDAVTVEDLNGDWPESDTIVDSTLNVASNEDMIKKAVNDALLNQPQNEEEQKEKEDPTQFALPTRGKKAVSEYMPGYYAMAYPHLFPDGCADYNQVGFKGFFYYMFD